MTEELFGPVLSVTGFDTEEDVLRIAIGLPASPALVRGRLRVRAVLRGWTPMILPVVIITVALYAACLQLGLNGTPVGFVIGADRCADAGRGARGGKAEPMLRPERIDLSGAAGPQGASLPVMVEDVTILGNSSALAARIGWGDPLYIRLNFAHPMMGSVSRWDRLHVRGQPQDAHVFPKA